MPADLSFDYTGIARSGLMMCAGERGTPPSQIAAGNGGRDRRADAGVGSHGRSLRPRKDRQRPGVDTSLMGSIIALAGLIMDAPAMLGQEYPRDSRAANGNPLYNHYRCRDEKWIAVAHLQPDRYWPAFCRALDIADLEHDPKFNSIEARGVHSEELISILDQKFASKSG